MYFDNNQHQDFSFWLDKIQYVFHFNEASLIGKIINKMEAYDDFACTLDEDETFGENKIQSNTNTTVPQTDIFFHNSMTEKEAESRLRKAQLGSFLVRKKSFHMRKIKYQDPCEYWVSYNVRGNLNPQSINVMHKSLENCTGTQNSLQEALDKLDPNRTVFRHPLHINFSYERKTQVKTREECIKENFQSTSQVRTKLNILSCTLNSFYHGQISEKEATFRLKNSQVGSFLLRSVQPDNRDGLSYYVSYSFVGPYCHSKIGHTCLDPFIRQDWSLQKAMSKLDPNGTLFVFPLHPNLLYKQERVQTWKCDQCQYKTTNMELFVRHKDEEKMLLSLTPVPVVKIIKCEKCDFETVLRAEYVSHFRKTHLQKSWEVTNPKVRLVKTKIVKKVKGSGLTRENLTKTLTL